MSWQVGLMVARSQVRRRWASYVALAIVVALGGGAAIGAAIAAHRTDHAYPDYVARARVGALGVNPVVASVDVEEAMRGSTGSRRCTAARCSSRQSAPCHRRRCRSC